MHELSLCRGLLQQVSELAREHRAQTVSRITLRIGPLAGVEIPLLESAFAIARDNTVAAEAVLEVEPAPLRVHCNACETEHAVTLPDLRCPVCHSTQTRLISGDEMVLVSVRF
ncbi:MAG: hydrogenase maturation nickel metallochaperone HypA [Gammaproteobacteria bacterium]|nr:hydrogenase maturation nickel metallochaperone HypA [Gammaproteobacteria bacterium]MCW8993321.1 hydrogenase maturation nickel metallochaperone HypA [Gammaproteobacteria bacterium]